MDYIDLLTEDISIGGIVIIASLLSVAMMMFWLVTDIMREAWYAFKKIKK